MGWSRSIVPALKKITIGGAPARAGGARRRALTGETGWDNGLSGLLCERNREFHFRNVSEACVIPILILSIG